LPAIDESLHASPSASYPFPEAICVATLGLGPNKSASGPSRLLLRLHKSSRYRN
jgi:hypothetical protein